MADAKPIELPPLPQPGMKPQHWSAQDMPAFTPQEMRDFATRAVWLDRNLRPLPVAPIARLTIKDGACVNASLYAPGLPDGEHVVYPEQQ